MGYHSYHLDVFNEALLSTLPGGHPAHMLGPVHPCLGPVLGMALVLQGFGRSNSSRPRSLTPKTRSPGSSGQAKGESHVEEVNSIC